MLATFVAFWLVQEYFLISILVRLTTIADIFPSGSLLIFTINAPTPNPPHPLHLSTPPIVGLSKPTNQVSNVLFSLRQDVAHFPHRPTARSQSFKFIWWEEEREEDKGRVLGELQNKGLSSAGGHSQSQSSYSAG